MNKICLALGLLVSALSVCAASVTLTPSSASRVLESRADGSKLVEQKAVGGMFFLTRTVTILLEVRRGEAGLRLEDVGREDFWRYEGSWTTEETAGGTRVSYHLVAQPDFPAPSLIMSRVMKRGAGKLLDEIRVEILKRSGLEGIKP